MDSMPLEEPAMEPKVEKRTEDARPEVEGSYYMVGPFTRKQVAGAMAVALLLLAGGAVGLYLAWRAVGYLGEVVYLLERP